MRWERLFLKVTKYYHIMPRGNVNPARQWLCFHELMETYLSDYMGYINILLSDKFENGTNITIVSYSDFILNQRGVNYEI